MRLKQSLFLCLLFLLSSAFLFCLFCLVSGKGNLVLSDLNLGTDNAVTGGSTISAPAASTTLKQTLSR